MDDELLMAAMIEAPNACEDKIEYDNRIEDITETEMDAEEEAEGMGIAPRSVWDESDREFTRYERNYRARRIRELTKAPVKEGKSKAEPTSDQIAA
ncbi:MAG: hypothetical protein NT018_01825 [Armatimonadetes bacterium]|nr:hypothetical protein [Armatimonadota bacterium]